MIKKKSVILIWLGAVLIVISVGLVLNSKREAEVVGKIVKLKENTILIETNAGRTISIPRSELDTNLNVSLGEEIVIFYDGEIVETSPAMIHGIKKIKKK